MQRIYRLLWLVVQLLSGVAIVAFLYPFSDSTKRLQYKQRWARRMLNALGVRLETSLQGVVPKHLMVANHISWLDILVINAAVPAAFVAKREIRHWPVIGWLTAKTDNVFLHRERRTATRSTNADIAKLLDAGKHVVIFPESKTGDGITLQHFHAALLQPAIDMHQAIQPLALTYWDKNQRTTLPAYLPELSLLQSVLAVCAARGLRASLVATPPISAVGVNRRQLADAAYQRIDSVVSLNEISMQR